MLREEYENLKKGDLLVEYFLDKELYKNIYVFFDYMPNNFLLVQRKESLEVDLEKITLRNEARRKYFEMRPLTFHYLDLQLATSKVIYDNEEIYRKLSVRYKKVPTKKENKIKGIYRIKPVRNRELYIEFKGKERKSPWGIVKSGRKRKGKGNKGKKKRRSVCAS